MIKPFPAYVGSEPYVFVCYAHGDSESVYSDLLQIHSQQIHVWYDEGITAGSSWRSEIASAITGAAMFLFYISEASLASAHCLREVDYALSNNIQIIPVYLDDSELPGELALVLNRVQALYRVKDAQYMQHLLQGLRQTTPLARLLPTTNKSGQRTFLPWLVISLSALMLFAWIQRDLIFSSEKVAKNSVAAPNAYDAYLKGLGLLERWDVEGNLDQAISLFQEVSELNPDFALAYARLAEAFRIRYALSGDDVWLEQAVSSVNEALRLDENLAPVQVALGRIQTTQGNADLAFVSLERALEIDPNDAEANIAIAKLYARSGRSKDAEVSFRKAVALSPESPSIINSYAAFLYEQSRFEDATSQWKKVIRLVPDHYAALLNLGSVYQWTGDVPEAINMYERSIEIKPTYMAYSNLGTAFSREKRYSDAVAAYKQAMEIDDSDWLAWGNLALLYSKMDGMQSQAPATFEHAIELAEKSRDQNPREVFVHSDLALYYAKIKQKELAIERLETAIALAPDSTEILASAVVVYEVLGQREKAVMLAHKALALGHSVQQFRQNPELSKLLDDPAMLDVFSPE